MLQKKEGKEVKEFYMYIIQGIGIGLGFTCIKSLFELVAPTPPINVNIIMTREEHEQ